jgi:hypothetical protein
MMIRIDGTVFSDCGNYIFPSSCMLYKEISYIGKGEEEIKEIAHKFCNLWEEVKRT